MPIYEYQCDKCGHEFERDQRMSDPPVKTCPKCKARRVTKLISLSSFSLKGGGWYADGYADAKGKDKGSSDSDSSSSSSAESDSKKSDKSKKGDAKSKKDSSKASKGGKKGKQSAA